MILVLNFADLDFHHQSLIPHPVTKNNEKRAIELGSKLVPDFCPIVVHLGGCPRLVIVTRLCRVESDVSIV